MKSKIISARRAIDFPWAYGLSDGTYEMSSGKRTFSANYTKSAWAYACMQVRGTELASLPWHLYRNDEIVEDHPLIEMIEDFGPENTYSEAVAATEIDLLMYGAAYWVRDYDILKRLSPGTMEAVRNNAGITGFKQVIDGKTVNTFKREEIVYFREFNPDDDLGVGIPVMEIIAKAVGTEAEALMYIEAFFKNDATPSLLLSTEQVVPIDEAKRTLAWWNKLFKGTRNKHKTGIADRGLKAQILARSIRENALIEVRDQARGDICVGMRVPKILIGAMEDATYANAQESRKFMIEDLIIPRSRHWADVINTDLVKYVDDSVEFRFAEDELQILQEDVSLKEARLASMHNKKIISDEYYRQEMGIEDSAAPVKEPVPDFSTSETDDEQPQVARSWAKKAKKALKRGESANVPFETDELPDMLQNAIRAQLSQATTPREIESVFAGDFKPKEEEEMQVHIHIPESVTMQIPEQQAPVVNVNVPEQAAPQVTVEPAPVTVNVPKIVSTDEIQDVERDSKGKMKGTSRKTIFNYGETE